MALPSVQQQASTSLSHGDSINYSFDSRASLPPFIRPNSVASASSSSSYPTSLGSTPTLASTLPSYRGYEAQEAVASAATSQPGQNVSSTPGSIILPDILDRPRDKSRSTQVAASSLSFLYAEMVAYTQARVTGIADLEKKLSLFGYHIGSRLLTLNMHRLEAPSSTSSSLTSAATKARPPKRETRLLPVLRWVHSQFWKAAFGKPADSLERSTENSDEYMISTNTPLFARSMSVPNDMSQLSVEAISAGMVEAVLDGLGFPARVTAHSVPTPDFPSRTTVLIKLHESVMSREDGLGPG